MITSKRVRELSRIHSGDDIELICKELLILRATVTHLKQERDALQKYSDRLIQKLELEVG